MKTVLTFSKLSPLPCQYWSSIPRTNFNLPKLIEVFWDFWDYLRLSRPKSWNTFFLSRPPCLVRTQMLSLVSFWPLSIRFIFSFCFISFAPFFNYKLYAIIYRLSPSYPLPNPLFVSCTIRSWLEIQLFLHRQQNSNYVNYLMAVF